MSDKYAFLKTAQRDGDVVALIADKEVLGESGVAGLRKAFAVAAKPVIRQGVLTLNTEELAALKGNILKSGQSMPESIKALDRATVCIEAKKNGTAPPAIRKPVAAL